MRCERRRRSRLPAGPGALLLALALGAPVANAQRAASEDAGEATSEEAVTQAKKLHAMGTTNFDLGRFEQALSDFKDAYARAPLPGFLFNIGLCHRKLARHAEAVTFFERYLAEATNAPNRADVEAMLVEERQLALDAAARDAATSAASAASDATPAETAPAAATPVDDEDRTWIWAAAGGALVVLAAAGTVAVVVATSAPPPLATVDLRGSAP